MRSPCQPLGRQRGNALVFALLGLLVSALGAAGAIQGARLQARHEAGNGEATILENLRGATNNAILESMGLAQNGAPIGRNGVTVAPVTLDGELVWQPRIADLVAMGYLPPGWTATVSTLNNAPYAIEFRRVPAGCVASACDIEGHIVLGAAIRASAGATDGAVIGPILARIGADAGVSLPTDPTRIVGFGNTWSVTNPVAGQPAGVVAVRVGTASSSYGQFVRIGDSRDPNLAGNLTVAGNTLFGDGGTRSEFRSALQVDAQPVSVRNAGGTDCVSLRPDGAVDILCRGSLSATSGVFRDASGHATSIAGTGLATDGDVTAGNDVVAAGTVKAGRLTLSDAVNEGDPCSAGQVAMMATGGLAACQGGSFRATSRYSSLGAACAPAGLQAVDAVSADTLVCRGGWYASQSGLTSSRVYMAGFAVRHGDYVAAATALPNGCPATAGPVAPQATIFLLPQSDAETPGNAVLNRNAQWTGQGWAISLTDGAGAATASNVVAEVYCLYP